MLDRVLRMLHPVMPFVTEAIWRALTDADEQTSLMRSKWQSADAAVPARTRPR